MTYKTLPDITTERNVIFTTKAIPEGGTVSINPDSGEIGDRFVIEVKDWVSDYPKVVFNVYETEDP